MSFFRAAVVLLFMLMFATTEGLDMGVEEAQRADHQHIGGTRHLLSLVRNNW
jgi:hypothetical protein